MLTPVDIKIEMLKKGITGGDIGRSIGVTRTAIALVINRKRVSPRLRRAIATAINMPYEEVWGEEKMEGQCPTLRRRLQKHCIK